MKRILIIDDEIEICRSLKELLDKSGFLASYCTDSTKAIEQIQRDNPNLIILDVRMPEIGGIDLLKAIKKQQDDIPIIMITGYPNFNSAVSAMRYGAVNIFPKPIQFKQLLSETQTVLSYINHDNRGQTIHPIKFPKSSSKLMNKVLKIISKVSKSDAPVIIDGESGTGKELVAKELHEQSERAGKPFVKVNCAAIPENLLETELFGNEAGAFTDARSSREGKFEKANNGSLFLDEIGDMDPRLQTKILRVIQEQEFERVGGNKPIKSNTRIICATNKDINSLIKTGDFREDLYYRLSVVEISLPPLRKRKEDIENLAYYFLETFNSLYNKKIDKISPDVVCLLLNHNWPGNIRELKNCIERAVIFCENKEITTDDLPDQYINKRTAISESSYENAVDELEKNRILQALHMSNGVKSHAAEILKINRKTLYNKMKHLGLE